MPALCAYTDLHNISLLLYKSPTEFWYKNFPYVYSPDLFSCSFSKEEFYTDIFRSFCDENKIKYEACDVLLADVFHVHNLNIGPKLSVDLQEVINRIENYYPFVVNSSFVLTKDACYSVSHKIENRQNIEVNESAEENFYANLALYPQVVPVDFSVQFDIDRDIASLPHTSAKTPQNFPLVFCGSRFAQDTFEIELDYLLILDLVKTPGVYDIRRDANNSLILSTLLKMHNPDAVLELDLAREATLLTSKNPVECLVTTDVDTSQLVQLDRDKLLVLPVAGDQKVKIQTKSREIPSAERKVSGGRIGLIFDTRVVKSTRPEDIKVFDSGVKMFKEALGK